MQLSCFPCYSSSLLTFTSLLNGAAIPVRVSGRKTLIRTIKERKVPFLIHKINCCMCAACTYILFHCPSKPSFTTHHSHQKDNSSFTPKDNSSFTSQHVVYPQNPPTHPTQRSLFLCHLLQSLDYLLPHL